jgi:hypothetical protein
LIDTTSKLGVMTSDGPRAGGDDIPDEVKVVLL